MKPLLTHTSLRTVLFSILVVLGVWGLGTSLVQMADSFEEYRDSRRLSEAAYVSAQLLTAAQHIAFERGRTAVVLRNPEVITPQNRTFLDERRRLAETPLNAVLPALPSLTATGHAEISRFLLTVRSLREQIDRAASVPAASRDKTLVSRWLDASNGLLRSLQHTTTMLAAAATPGTISGRIIFLAITALDLRLMAGTEASAVAQAVSAGAIPNQRTLHEIHRLRGGEDRLWQEIAVLIYLAEAQELRDDADSVRQRHLAVFRPLQDQALESLAAGQGAAVSLEKLTAASVPVLDGMSALTTLAAGEAAKVADTDMRQAFFNFWGHAAWFVCLLLVLTLAMVYVVQRIVKPLEAVDREILRLGALPPETSRKGNEIDRIAASARALEESLAARATAEEARKQTILELQSALEQIKTLSGFLPICASCKKIRDDQGYWEQVEEYIAKHTDAKFSHAYCPDCAKKLLEDFKGKP